MHEKMQKEEAKACEYFKWGLIQLAEILVNANIQYGNEVHEMNLPYLLEQDVKQSSSSKVLFPTFQHNMALQVYDGQEPELITWYLIQILH